MKELPSPPVLAPPRQRLGWDRGIPPPQQQLQLRAPRRRGSSETGGEAGPRHPAACSAPGRGASPFCSPLFRCKVVCIPPKNATATQRRPVLLDSGPRTLPPLKGTQ